MTAHESDWGEGEQLSKNGALGIYNQLCMSIIFLSEIHLNFKSELNYFQKISN